MAVAFSFNSPKTLNVTGYADDLYGHLVSAPFDERGCSVNLDINCSITAARVTYQPIYNNADNVGNPADILMYSE